MCRSPIGRIWTVVGLSLAFVALYLTLDRLSFIVAEHIGISPWSPSAGLALVLLIIKGPSAEIARRKRPLRAPIRFDKIEPCIKSWDVAQRQPADPGKVAPLRKEDVAEPAIRRIKPRASFLEEGPTRSADQDFR